jgi:hypothetical protein
MFTERTADCKVGGLESECLAGAGKCLEELGQWLAQAAREGTALHAVERHLFREMLALGHGLMRGFLTMVGPGDLGPTLSLEDGRSVKRWPQPQSRRLVTVFGEFSVSRYLYGTRPDQKIELAPTDQRLELPEGEVSYLLQEWDQLLGIEHAFGSARQTLQAMLGLNQPVDTLERGNRQMAQAAPGFRQAQAAPKPEEEGALLVVSEDNKGVPMVRPAEMAAAGCHRSKGQKANKKQMACIGCVYTVEPHVRSPEELTASLFRDADRRRAAPPPARQKRYWVALTREEEGQVVQGQEEVFAQMAQEIARRRKPGQTLLHLSDGQRSLETDRRAYLPADSPEAKVVDILDLMHVTPRLWEAAHLFYAEGSDAATQCVRQRLERVLEGQAAGVVSGLRQMGTKHGLVGAKRARLTRLCQYLEGNLHRMHYDEYLAAGYPIATGVIEGACRHVIKDRMERAGMRWKVPGAQAMLQLRAIHANGDWGAFQTYRIQQETARLYPHKLLETMPQAKAA